MKIEIRPPCYYSQHHAVDEEITGMARMISAYMEDRSYSEIISTVDIVPVVAPENILEEGLWEEEVMLTRSTGRISVFKYIDYLKYLNGSAEKRKKLTVKCILEAVKLIRSKPGTKFDVNQFGIDLLGLLNYEPAEIEEL